MMNDINKLIARNRELESNVRLLEIKIKAKNKEIKTLKKMYQDEVGKNKKAKNLDKQETFDFN